MAKAKVVNYTSEQTAEMVAAYMLAPTKETISELATKFGKTTRSIVAKLSREKVYRKAEYVTKAGTKPEPKTEIVAAIAAKLGKPVADLDSLAAASKAALVLIRDALPKN